MTARIRDLVLALLLAGLAGAAGTGVHELLADSRTPALAPVGDRVQRAVEAFEDGDHVYVAADAHDLVTPETEARLQELAAATDIPVRIAVWEESSQAGYRGIWDAVSQLERLGPEQGVYVVYTGPGDGVVDDNLDGRLVGEIPGDFNGDAERRLSEIVAAVDRAKVDAGHGSDYWGGTGGAIAAGLLMGALAVPVVLLVIGLGRLALGRRFRMVGGWR